MKDFIIAEAIGTEQIINEKGEKLYCARTLAHSSPKYTAISKMLRESPITYFLQIGQYLASYLKMESPLVFVTDWTDPTELIGLRLETDGHAADYPKLCFLAFYTDWDDISSSGIKDIFSHEFSHMWMDWLGMDFSLSQSNKFHTCTAVTDPYMAFSEGFAEHLQIVTKDIEGFSPKPSDFWDCAYDANMWLCARDRQLRYHAVKNNRFIYHTATPYKEDFDTYEHLHMAHITSTSFTPEKLKNGSQMTASEGVVAAVFYQMYVHELFKNTYMNEAFYEPFGANPKKVDPVQNLYIKIMYSISKISLKKPSLMTDFIRAYGECFPNEKEKLYELFASVTHFATISASARDLFGEMYRIGRRGNIADVRDIISARNQLKDALLAGILEGKIPLDAAVYKELWIDSDREISPTPWEPDEKATYRFNINTATAVDFLSLDGMTINMAEELVRLREKQNGFNSIEEFCGIKKSVDLPADSNLLPEVREGA